MNPLQTELLARDIADRRSRLAAHPFPPSDPGPLPPRRRPLAWARAALAAIASPAPRLGAGAGADAG